jgi:hypothetical protein
MSMNTTRGLFITLQETIRDTDPDSPIDSAQQKTTLQLQYRAVVLQITHLRDYQMIP